MRRRQKEEKKQEESNKEERCALLVAVVKERGRERERERDAMVDENSLASVYRSVAHTQYTMHWMQWGKRAGKGGSRKRFLLHTL